MKRLAFQSMAKNYTIFVPVRAWQTVTFAPEMKAKKHTPATPFRATLPSKNFQSGIAPVLNPLWLIEKPEASPEFFQKSGIAPRILPSPLL